MVKYRKTKKMYCAVCGKHFWWAKQYRNATCCSGNCKAAYRSWKSQFLKYKKNPDHYIKYLKYVKQRTDFILSRLEEFKNECKD